VLATNRAFYDAFEARDLDRMSDIWEHSDRVLCTHPGWATLRGWGQISASWVALFSGAQHLQFILTDERVRLRGPVAWVTVDENLIGQQTGQTVAALNLFHRVDGEWLLWCHHGSAVAPRPPRSAEP